MRSGDSFPCPGARHRGRPRACHRRPGDDPCARARDPPDRTSLQRVTRHQAGCQALMTQFGVEEPIALTLLTQVPGRHPNIGLAQSHPGSRGSTSACTLAIRPTASESSPARVPHVALGALSSCPVQPLGPEPDHADHHALKARGLTHTQTHPHPRIADDRAQDRPAPLIPPTSAWTRRRKTSRARSPPSTDAIRCRAPPW